MKNVRKLGFAGIVATMVFFGACTDDTVDPGNGNGNGGGGNTEKSCKVTQTIDNDNLKLTYTYNGDDLVQMVEDDDGEITTYNFNYVGGKLTEITENGDDSYKMTYTADQITKVEFFGGTELEDIYEVTYNTDGTLKEVDEFLWDGTDKVLFSNFAYSYANGDLSSVVNLIDANDDGMLSDTIDETVSITVLALDGKKNPLYGLPIYLIDFANFLALTKANVNAATITFFDIPFPVVGTYTYNDNNYPIQSIIDTGDSTITNFTYICE